MIFRCDLLQVRSTQSFGAMSHDKKRRGKTLRFVVPRQIGDVMIVDNPGCDMVRTAVEAITER